MVRAQGGEVTLLTFLGGIFKSALFWPNFLFCWRSSEALYSLTSSYHGTKGRFSTFSPTDLHGSWWGKPDLSPFGEEDALCHFWGKPLGAHYDAVQELKLQTGDLSDLRYRPKGSVALQGATWLPALTPDVKRTNKIPEWKHGALRIH